MLIITTLFIHKVHHGTKTRRLLFAANSAFDKRNQMTKQINILDNPVDTNPNHHFANKFCREIVQIQIIANE